MGVIHKRGFPPLAPRWARRKVAIVFATALFAMSLREKDTLLWVTIFSPGLARLFLFYP
jgi:hypothetical protein